MHEPVFAALETCLNDLHKQAAAAVDEHWEQLIKAEKQTKTWDDKSHLQVASYRQGNHIQMKWIGIKWTGNKGSRRQVKNNITRSGDDMSYSEAKLAKWAKEWELPIVLETEKKLTSIRKQAHYVVRSLMAIRNAASLAAKNSIDADADDGEV